LLKLDLLVIVELAKHAYMEELVRRVHGVDLDLDKLPALEDPFAVDEKTLEVFAAARSAASSSGTASPTWPR
jgi:hypothetical protein